MKLLVSMLFLYASCLHPTHLAFGDGPEDNKPKTVRPIPPDGMVVDEIASGQLRQAAQAIAADAAKIESIDALSRAQILVLSRAIEITLDTNMIYEAKELEFAQELMQIAAARLLAAREGKRGAELLAVGSQVKDQSRLTIGGYVSNLDGSVQPFGLVLPPQATNEIAARLDIWLHGRGEKQSEVAFLQQRLNNIGEFAPEQTIVLHPYGRYCNANRFAGEVDVLESIDTVKSLFKIDSQRMTIRGFSMGGAGCWQLAVHYPNLWVAANPGAGFCETREFLGVFQKQAFEPTATQQQLLHWYDCPEWTNNLRNLQTVAYSGEIDKQKQAADLMAAAFTARGMTLEHIIGQETAHKILEDCKPEIQAKLDMAINAGKEPYPASIDFTTYTLRYSQMGWVQVLGLSEHWVESRVQGELATDSATLVTSNVRCLKVSMPGNRVNGSELSVTIDGKQFAITKNKMGDFEQVFRRQDGEWMNDKSDGTVLEKRPQLQGPIDDAFMDSFMFVPPTTQDATDVVASWAQQEYEHATHEWRRHFRGDIRSIPAGDVNAQIAAESNLILFGTPQTNPLIAKLLGDLPITWNAKEVRVGNVSASADYAVPLLIFPNPMNPKRYVVLNSGFTFREFAYLNNARQIAMLPDWAVVDVRDGANFEWPGKVVGAGFFDEFWKVK